MRIVIAGGGTAGWLAAALLTRQLADLVQVTLVESEAIGTIGVGEATIPTVRSFHALLGLDEAEFMAATGASFKLGIAFEGWAQRDDRYVHSFGEVGRSTWMGDFQHFWLEAQRQGAAAPIGAYCLEHEAAEAGRFVGGPDTPLNYAYHFDAGRYAAYLRRRSEAQGLTRIEGRIARVERDPMGGDIAALVLDDGQRVEGDLFLDCTGFHALLIERTLGVGFEDWGHWLPTDRALAVQTRSVGPAPPYTRAIAHDAGWRWQIPLQHRVGNGLVYSSRHLDDDAARERLLASIEGETLIEPRLIRFRTGRRMATWERNCVALSLSSGFVEPLESTSLHLVMIALTRLVQLLPFGHPGAAARARFNDQGRREIEAVRDFVLLHYHLNQRDDPFWRERREITPPDSLAERIALFAEGAHTYQSADDLFRVGSWVQVMLGQRLAPVAWHPLARAMPPGELGAALDQLRGGIAATVAQLPTHQQFLDAYCRSPD
ncbi:tryptophan 7-halogenase [Sphingomonas sp. 2R-10]|uniref:tryptophan halogenase family protein n=1 Tax=Sphingomonas sp. 2R-10 TaxID=3045148 RepID=UPI0019D07FFE|nr:tryptophan halogenase family protein [Sphingomonas sp. 2R-10]MDJ0276106.1 tryptophan 7-halogenase [Sphingomonas sp. 2R-10]